MKSILKIVLPVLLTAAVIAGVYVFMFVRADAPALADTFTLVVGDHAQSITSAAFAADFGAALDKARLSPFGQGEKQAVIFSGKDEFVLSRTSEGLCVTAGLRNYLLDAETAEQIAGHPGLNDFYLDVFPRPLIVEIGDKTWHVPPTTGEWEYLGIDGRMHRYAFGEMCPQIINLKEESVVRFDFEEADTAPHIIYGDHITEQTGDETTGKFTILPGQNLTLSATPTYDTDTFRGQLSFVISFEVGAESDDLKPNRADEPTDTVLAPETTPYPPPPPPAEETTPVAVLEPANPMAVIEDNGDYSEGDLSFGVSATDTYPGEMLTLTVTGASAAEITCDTGLRASPRFFDTADGAIALIPVRLSVEPGSYGLTLSARGQSESWKIEVQPKEFVVQHLTVDQSTAEETILSQQANNEYNQKIEPLKTIFDPEVYWSGSFILPVQGRITTEFGTQRYTNGSTTPSWHAAIDIGAARGTEVKATQSGRVLFSEYIALTGNTILIEHGIGLKSWYYHMDSLSVATGDRVTQGQTIGTVGSTGFSTGPHLHFGMSVGEYYVNPWSFID